MITNPKMFKKPLAEDSDKSDIFDNEGFGKFTADGGFPQETSLPLQAGGVAPKREDFNGALNAIGEHLFMLQKGYNYEYDEQQDYYFGCIVVDKDADGKRDFYVCINDMGKGTISPHEDTDKEYWKTLSEFIGGCIIGDGKLTIRQNGNVVGQFTANQSTDVAVDLEGGGSSVFSPDPVTLRRKIVNQSKTKVTLHWRDPKDKSIAGIVVSEWAKTVIVKKNGSLPTSPNDGIEVVTSNVRDEYYENGYEDDQENGDEWFYRAFPFSTNNDYSKSRLNDFQYYKYGVVINGTDVSAQDDKMVAATGVDNEFYAKPYMDFSNDKFIYGGWEKDVNIPFMGKPCMVKSDGTVLYYLDPYDLTKKEDGTPSDITNKDFDGNAMMEMPLCFMKWTVDEATGKQTIYLCSEKEDSSYEAYPWLKADGTYNQYMYRSIYCGSYYQNKIRSYSSGAKPGASQTMATEKLWAENNGDGWSMSTWAFRGVYCPAYFYIIFMHPNWQAKLGSSPTSTTALTLNCGVGNQNGYFYGKTSGVTKFMGFENLCTQRWDRVLGITTLSTAYYVKMTKHTGDGSTATDYNLTGEGYISTGKSIPNGLSQAYIVSVCGGNKLGPAPSAASGGSATTHFCDGAWTGASPAGVDVGGAVYAGLLAGVDAWASDSAPSHTYWNVGSALEYRPQ